MWSSLRRIWSPFQSCPAVIYAAAACFYLFLSMLPAFLFLSALLPYLPASEFHWNEILLEAIPDSFLPVLEGFWLPVSQNSSPAILSLSGLIVLWSASKGMGAIMDGIYAVLDEEVDISFFRRRFRAMGSFLLLLFSVFLMLGVYVFGEQFLTYLPRWTKLTSWLIRLRPFYTMLLLIVEFSLMFWFLPGCRLPFRSCLAGAALSGAGWVLFSYGFSVYVDQFSHYQQLYGGIGLAILAAIWLQSCLALLLYGAKLSSLLAGGNYTPLIYLHEAFKGRS